MSTPESLSADVLEPIRALFFQECVELLGDLEQGLLALKDGNRDPEVINTIFRAVHSIKGGAASFGLEALVGFAHAFESVLADIRAGTFTVTPKIPSILLGAADVLADQVAASREGRTIDTNRLRDAERQLADIRVAQAVEHSSPAGGTGAVAALEHRWMVRFSPHSSLYKKGNDPLVLLRSLASLGAMGVKLDHSRLPLLDALDPDASYLSWEISLDTFACDQAIREVFEFVEGDCNLSIEGARPADDDANASTERTPAADSTVQPPWAQTGLTHAKLQAETIRVDLDRVDRLVNLVSELVVSEAMLAQQFGVERARHAGAELPLGELSQLTREIQDCVMTIRAQPVRSVFQRMWRVAREAEAATGKSVELVARGEETEVDRTIIEQLTDPLTHMIRNAIDHGIETPELRAAKGKPAKGTICLSASHRSGRIVIEVSDDGRGIDRARVLATAIKQGVVTGDTSLSEQEIDNLIFAPGFSTATEVSALSGRGVGMDVVKRGVQALGGRISVVSAPGQGCTFTLVLPLTLAVLDGMTITVDGHQLIAPLTALVETVRPGRDHLSPLGADGLLLRFRGEYLPLVDLGVTLGYRPQARAASDGVALVVEGEAGQRAALLVDEILGQRQVVIKSIRKNYRAVDGIAAATILGDGRVAYILDVDAIVAPPRRDAFDNGEARMAG